MTKRTGILARISLDPDGESESPDQQLGDGHGLAAQRGWEVVDTYVERDVSAFKRGVKRPEYDRLVRDMRAGKLDVVVVWAIDRLTRQGVVGISKFLAVMEETGVELVSVTQPFIDSTTPLGRGVLAMIASLAEQESANISTRVKRSQRYAAKNGRAHHGGTRKFGRAADGAVIEAEAQVAREVVDRVLAGESFRGVATWLNDTGVQTSTGGRWVHTAVASMVKAPHLAGLRVVDGTEVPCDLAPIISTEQRRAVLAALAKPQRDRSGDQPKLLAGVLRCARCRVALKHLKQSSGFPRYVCVRGPGSAACGKVAVTLNGVERHVTGELLDLLASCKLRPLEGEDDEPRLEAELAAAKESLTELTRDRFVHRSIPRADFEAVQRELSVQLDRLGARLDALRRGREQRQQDVPLGDRAALQRWWDGADDAERRATVRWALGSVEVAPAAVKGGSRFQGERVRLWPDWSVLMLAASRGDASKWEETHLVGIEHTPYEVPPAPRTTASA